MGIFPSEEHSEWVVCLHCLHVWHIGVHGGAIFGKDNTSDMPCSQCGERGKQHRISVAEVTHALRRHIPKSIKQYTMKTVKVKRKEAP